MILVKSTVRDVCAKEDVGYEAIMGIIDWHIECSIRWEDITQRDVLGLDEISLKKGHRDFVTILTGRSATETMMLGVLPERKKATVKAFLSAIPQRLRRTIQSVCTDMSEGFVHAAQEVFEKRIQIVIERFHVAKLYRRSMDQLRKQELKRLQKEWSAEEYGQLQGAMWALRKPQEQLTDKDNDVLMHLLGFTTGHFLSFK